MRGARFSRCGSRAGLGPPAALAVLVAATVLILAGCGPGGEDPTTTTTAGIGPTTTASVPSNSSDTTAVSVEVTTTTEGIVISIPSTSTSEMATTTTEKLSSAEKKLANGHIKAMGYIDKVYIEDGKRYISIDYAEMLSGDAAIEAAIEAGYIGPGEDLPNDYWISNESPQKRTFEVSGTVAITTSTRWVGGDDMNAPCSWNDFRSFWGPDAGLDDSEKHLDKVPWWIERDGPMVIKIDEQYLP